MIWEKLSWKELAGLLLKSNELTTVVGTAQKQTISGSVSRFYAYLGRNALANKMGALGQF